MRNIRVFYNGDLNTDFDDAIRGVVEKFGLRQWASGYDLRENRRDLAFDVPEGNDRTDQNMQNIVSL